MIKCKKFLHGKKNLKGSSTWQKRNKNHWTIPFIFFCFLIFFFFLRFHLHLGWFPSSLLWSLILFGGFPFLYSVVLSDFFCVVNYLFHICFPVVPLFFFHVHVRSQFFLHSHSMWSTDRSVLKKGHSGLLTPSILGPSWVALVYPVLFCRRPISFLSSRCFRSSGGYLLVGWYILV
jgi:hypothetical protein